MLVDVSVAEKVDKEGKMVLEVHMPSYLPGRPRSDRRTMTPDDAKMVLELVKVRSSTHPSTCTWCSILLHLSSCRAQYRR